MTRTTESLMELRKLARELIGFGNVCMNKLAQAGGVAIHELLDAITELVAERDALAKENERHKMHIKNIGNDALRTENHTLRAQLDALQSGDELPEPDKCEGGWESPCVYYYSEEKVRQAQAMARAKLLAELGEVEAVAWQVSGPYERSVFRDILSAEAFCNGLNRGYGEDAYSITKLYTRPLPAQDVNAELVKALEAAQRWHNGDKWRDTDKHEEWAAQAEMISTSLANAKSVQQKGGE